MRQVLVTSVATGIMAVFLLNAHANDGKDPKSATEPVVGNENAVVETVDQENSIMDQPVNFSTPEEVEKSLQKVREQEGDNALKGLESAMKYILYYDLSLGGDKQNLYRKLDGKTPNDIMALMQR